MTALLSFPLLLLQALFVTHAVTQKVQLDLYLESLCYDTDRFVRRLHDQDYPKVKRMVGPINYHIYGKAHSYDCNAQQRERYGLAGRNDTPCYAFSCQHGSRECHMNQYMLCGLEDLRRKENTTDSDYLSFVDCTMMKADVRDAETCAQSHGLSSRAIEACASGVRGMQLHAAAGTQTFKLFPRGLGFVPSVGVNGRFAGSSGHRDLARVVLQEYLRTNQQNTPEQ